MKTIHTRGHVKADGTLELRVATELPESDVDVLVVVETAPDRERPEKLSWPEFVDRFAGICADDPIKRGDQGTYEKREALE